MSEIKCYDLYFDKGFFMSRLDFTVHYVPAILCDLIT